MDNSAEVILRLRARVKELEEAPLNLPGAVEAKKAVAERDALKLQVEAVRKAILECRVSSRRQVQKTLDYIEAALDEKPKSQHVLACSSCGADDEPVHREGCVFLEKRICVCRPMSYQAGLDGNCVKCKLPMEKRKCECGKEIPPSRGGTCGSCCGGGEDRKGESVNHGTLEHGGHCGATECKRTTFEACLCGCDGCSNERGS